MQVKQARKTTVLGRMTAVCRVPSKYNCLPNDCNKNRIQKSPRLRTIKETNKNLIFLRIKCPV